MARHGGQDSDVAGLEREDSTIPATEADAPVAARDASTSCILE
jgi:hypothetical protein